MPKSIRRSPGLFAQCAYCRRRCESRWPAAKAAVNIVQNLSGDLIDGGAEPYYDTDDVGDRAGCLDVDEQ
eukprot:5196517-Prymnesium_polylepis.1